MMKLTSILKSKAKCLALGLLAGCLFSAATYSQEGQRFVSDPSAKKYALIVVGASYDEKGEKQFKTWALELRESLIKEFGYSASNLKVLLGNESKKNIGSDGKANAENIKNTFADFAKKIKPLDQFLIVMFGSGSGSSSGSSTGDGATSKYQIVGPDVTGLEFAEMMSALKTQNIVVVNTTSASHEFTKTLASPGRVLLSATRSRAEKYDTIFPHYFVEAFKDKNADRDKNDRVSVLESFIYASNKVASYYKENDILPSEHATLEDNDDGIFSVDPQKQNDGRIAEIAYYDVDALSQVNLSPKVAALKSQMNLLERDIFLLRGQKNQLEASEYWQRLEPLLIELAKTTRDFHAAAN